MTEAVAISSPNNRTRALSALLLSVKSWFAIALTGQWIFALYIFSVYVATLMLNIDIGEVTPTQGYRKTGTDYFVFFVHIVPAAYLSLFGGMQLVPAIRQRFRAFHRWNGRIFFVLGLSGALTGLYLQWVTGLRLSDIGSLGITLNGLLILVAITKAWQHAVNKRFDAHLRWAVHSFILVNAVWSFRLYLMGWYMVNQGPNGNTRNIDGPTDIVLSFACYLLPMLLVELYFYAKRQRDSGKIWAITLLMSGGALITLIGVVAATLMMWSPRISQVMSMLF